jgi:hypothetical protein
VRQLLTGKEHPTLIERLDRVARLMNPLLFFIAVSLVVLNLAYVVNLINWHNPPAGTGAAERTATPGPGLSKP